MLTSRPIQATAIASSKRMPDGGDQSLYALATDEDGGHGQTDGAGEAAERCHLSGAEAIARIIRVASGVDIGEGGDR